MQPGDADADATIMSQQGFGWNIKVSKGRYAKAQG